MKSDLITASEKVVLVAAITVLYPFLFTAGYLAVIKTAMASHEK
jgi:hypothetical protein